jgi:hypothetical protein
LNVLVDSHEGESPEEIKARKEKAFMELKDKLKKFGVGDYVTAFGVDTRGHRVTRTGTLLDKPIEVTAQRNGVRTKGWRVFVGLAGTNTKERSTWVTLFPDTGSVEHTAEPTGWTNGELRGVPGVSARNRDARVLFGGKGGKHSTEPGTARLAGIGYTGDGRYEIWDVETGDVLLTCTLQTRIWWSPAPKDEEPAAEQQPENRSAPAEVAAPAVAQAEEKPKPRPGAARRGVLYEGWLATDSSLSVLHLETGKVIGWLTPDYSEFIPATNL